MIKYFIRGLTRHKEKMLVWVSVEQVEVVVFINGSLIKKVVKAHVCGINLKTSYVYVSLVEGESTLS